GSGQGRPLCHAGHGDHGPLERRYLIVPGIRSSRIYVLDTKRR
ncbi:MAG: selenium-binding protein, partial [Actinomycetia bacterium]|nr:selenium-binding protein [Actinomycetes bacterium]